MPRTAPVLRVDPTHPDPAALTEAGALLRAGGLLAFPTETVYGLGANARNADAVRRLFAVKGRPADNPLIVHVHEAAALEAVAASVPPLATELAARWWPGPLTLVVDAAGDLPPVTTGGWPTVGVRVPDHPVALALLATAGVPVAAPSANRSGRPSPTTAEHVLADLGQAVDLIVDGGPCRVGVESTVVDARGARPVVLREGGVPADELGAVRAVTAASPGTRYRHYAPDCRVEVVGRGALVARVAALRAEGHTVGVVAPAGVAHGGITLAAYTDTADLARRLYGALRAAEAAGLDVLLVVGVEERGIGRAVMDRLRRAAAG